MRTRLLLSACLSLAGGGAFAQEPNRAEEISRLIMAAYEQPEASQAALARLAKQPGLDAAALLFAEGRISIYANQLDAAVQVQARLAGMPGEQIRAALLQAYIDERRGDGPATLRNA
ncbi:MAG TPA: hypothetical protein VGE47_13330, partial [Burkholderiaceae bacterium]